MKLSFCVIWKGFNGQIKRTSEINIVYLVVDVILVDIFIKHYFNLPSIHVVKKYLNEKQSRRRTWRVHYKKVIMKE